ncbi:MAG: deoxyguanosinetriphosphate triphosphohydrolase [Dehalococcoidia bacterium]|nr:deoxyguanosinetriphosphate triphosphohydrolase [Dehalococcoidia bacterium]
MIHNDIRLRLERKEESLSPFAAQSRLSRGRIRQEEPSPMRTEYQRDRDRIIHSNSFRRLKHKTQVFIAPLGDHYVTRLSHTLEVCQIARTIARALNLNEDLTEAIALAHDLGHSPFGHAGEEVLSDICSEGFRHNEQSLRVVDLLEKDGAGLNLTWEVRDGILKHSKVREDIAATAWGTAATCEGQICKIADSIAYINHDILDAIRARVITEEQLPGSSIRYLGVSHSQRINAMVSDVIDSSWAVTGLEDLPVGDLPIIRMSEQMLEEANLLREFLFQQVYSDAAALKEAEKAKQLIYSLYSYFLKHLDTIPAKYFARDEPTERGIVDYIAGMTDTYALRLFEEIHVPRLVTN